MNDKLYFVYNVQGILNIKRLNWNVTYNVGTYNKCIIVCDCLKLKINNIKLVHPHVWCVYQTQTKGWYI